MATALRAILDLVTERSSLSVDDLYVLRERELQKVEASFLNVILRYLLILWSFQVHQLLPTLISLQQIARELCVTSSPYVTKRHDRNRKDCGSHQEVCGRIFDLCCL